MGYRAVGIRLDSGDLAYLSNVARQFFCEISEKFNIPWFEDLMIMASNDINEETILSLNEQGHKINCFGIGTHLVTCQRQPALGCVYKLVELNGQPRIKLSQDVGKVTMPGRKDAYRLYSESGHALVDLLQRSTEPPPAINEKVLCRHPFIESKRAYVIPSRVEKLLTVYWKSGVICQPLPNLQDIKERVQQSLRTLRPDIKRNLNPTPFKVCYSCFQGRITSLCFRLRSVMPCIHSSTTCGLKMLLLENYLNLLKNGIAQLRYLLYSTNLCPLMLHLFNKKGTRTCHVSWL